MRCFSWFLEKSCFLKWKSIHSSKKKMEKYFMGVGTKSSKQVLGEVIQLWLLMTVNLLHLAGTSMGSLELVLHGLVRFNFLLRSFILQ